MIVEYVSQKVQEGDISELTEDIILHHLLNPNPVTEFAVVDVQVFRDYIMTCEDYVGAQGGDPRIVFGMFVQCIVNWRDLVGGQ